MGHHKDLSLDERIAIRLEHANGKSRRAIGRLLNRAASTISRELRRLVGQFDEYRPDAAARQARQLRHKPRVPRKLSDDVRWDAVAAQVLEGWSPQQIAIRLKRENPDDSKARMVAETIYKAIYLQPRGALRQELISALRQGRSARKPRSQGKDRRSQIPDMKSIHVRPQEIEKRLVPGHWEGDLIKGAGNRSSVGTLVERMSGFLVLVPMISARAEDTLESFGEALETIPKAMRKTMTYDQGREMTYHAALTKRTGVAVYFADPHSPWQRGSNENTNGLLRQYLPKGTNLASFTQNELNAIALRLNTRPRVRLDGKTPLEVYTELIQLDQTPMNGMH
jgi:transposase, IS30 family